MILGIIILLGTSQNIFGGGYDAIYEKAIQSSSTLRHIHEDHAKWRTQEQNELNLLLDFIREHPHQDERLKEDIRVDLKTDLTYFSTLENKLKAFKVGENGTTFQLKTNKMSLGAQLALNLLEKSFDNILEGTLPSGYSVSCPEINIAKAENHIYSSGRGIALKHILVRTAIRLAGAPTIKVAEKVGFDPRESPFIHYTPLPTELNFKDMEISPYYINEGGGNSHYIAILHNGYAFGGHRNEEEKEFGPEDCSSFVTKYVGCKPVSTFHQAIYYRLWQYKMNQLSIPQELYQEVVGKINKFQKDPCILSLEKSLSTVQIRDVDQLVPGLVYSWRKTKNKHPSYQETFFGTGGHTSLVLGTQGSGDDAKVITIGANRDIEGTNRDFIFGVEEIPYNQPNLSLVMYFKIKE